MPHRFPRKRRVDELLKQEIARVVSEELVDPRLGFLTVMGVESTPDLRNARVYVSVLGSEQEKQASLAALKRASGFIRSRVGSAVTLKYLPELRFEIDRTLETASRIETILHGLDADESGERDAAGDTPMGLVLVDKPPGPTSHDVVARLRRTLGVRRVGHFGTLDPFASGLLVCAIGSATRLASFCADHDKTYHVSVRLGWTSTTDDPEGELRSVSTDARPTREDVERVCESWIGSRMQVPPRFSAKQIAGKRAYALARAGEEIDLPAVEVRIDRIGIEDYSYPDLELTVDCGGGTYMRALARDIGSGLETGGYCSGLRRVRSGPFRVATAVSWEGLLDPGTIRSNLVAPEEAIASMPRVRLDTSGQESIMHGRAVPHPGAARAGWVRIDGPEGFIGIGECQETEDGWVVHPRRILRSRQDAPR